MHLVPKHLVSIHSGSHFVKHFFKILSNGAVNFTFTQKRDYQFMGQTHDLLTTVAESLLDAVLIGTVSFRNSDLPVFDGDDIIIAISGIKDEFLRLPQIHNHSRIFAANLRLGCRRAVCRDQCQCQTQRKNSTEDHDPIFVFQRRPPLENTEISLPVSV